MSDKEKLLTIKGLKTYFPIKAGMFKKPTKFVQAVNEVDLVVYKGETLGLVGESGCGKTTLGKTILQLVNPTEGEMIYDFGEDGGEKDLRTLKGNEMNLARKKIQIVFQDPHSSLNPAFTIYQSLADPLKKFGIKTKEERRKIIGDILEAVNMRREYMDRYPHEFSGGQRQRIGIARALILNPSFIVADEPVSALDVSIQSQIVNLMMDLQEEMGFSYLFISHDLSIVKHICHKIGVMYLGNLVELASKNELYENPMHPYTKALLSAVPIPDPTIKRERIILKGDIPSPANPPNGCKFHTRCPYTMDKCKKKVPEYKCVGKDHFVACHLVD